MLTELSTEDDSSYQFFNWIHNYNYTVLQHLTVT